VGSEEGCWTDWFTLVRFPIAKVRVEEQVLFFAPTRRVGSLGELYSVLREDVWRVAGSRGVFEACFSGEVRLFDYFTGEELPVEVRLLSAECGWRGWREKGRGVPVRFKVVLRDRLWRREREVEVSGVLEVYSTRAEVRVLPSPGGLGYREEALVGGRKFVRTLSLFAATNEPFTPWDDDLARELREQLSSGKPAPRAKRGKRERTLSGYIDLGFFLRG